MQKEYYKLDNPAWYSLVETHASFALGNEEIKRYRSDLVAFAAYQFKNQISINLLDKLIEAHEYFFIIGDLM